MSPQALFEKLLSLSIDNSLPPEDIDLINLLEFTTGEKILQLEQPLRELEYLGYIGVERSYGNVLSITIRRTTWDPTRQIVPNSGYRPDPDQRRFVVLMDYKNIEDNLRNPVERFSDFGWLLDPILKEGIITFAFVFVPEHRTNRLAVVRLSNLHNFKVVVCPREFEGHISKDKDRVDAIMNDIARDLIEHSDCTDVVIISGDGDFTTLAVTAIWRGKHVHVLSAPESLSEDFKKLEGGHLQVVDIISP